jgi:hypothetical protein
VIRCSANENSSGQAAGVGCVFAHVEACFV